eukprot:CAMPEP_0206256854 /NCGR_PEP_ID=MMETSP0047_2-20121206/25012_1 /ASSEMBLY_ACC=CAM_ASM_000192 /TAXON_ID=195065 /ORGANISM="Chroomonas mesostigmatica_cf, Strain CCMP1168" /LENGTH=124 /DNA_ID=CAMNT_0053683367 /DNA_START=353 /DNA_END=724 /DNA_ORIENTATION=-
MIIGAAHCAAWCSWGRASAGRRGSRRASGCTGRDDGEGFLLEGRAFVLEKPLFVCSKDSLQSRGHCPLYWYRTKDVDGRDVPHNEVQTWTHHTSPHRCVCCSNDLTQVTLRTRAAAHNPTQHAP